MIVVDTNVLSQPLRRNGEQRVVRWIEQHSDEIHIPTLVIAEIVYGIELVDEWDRRNQLTNALAALRLRFDDRFLSFDISAADNHGWLQAKMKRSGGRLPEIDSQIAAIAISRGAAIATRNIRDFERTGLKLIDPWTA